MLKAQLKRRNVTYAQLVEKLAVKEFGANARNKIARGAFTAVFFVQCLEEVGVREIRL